MEARKIIIVGAGPAGYTAALYTARAQLSPLVFEGSMPGGWLTTTTEVENYPGFEHGVMGTDLMNTMRAQALRFGAEIVTDMVTGVDVSQHPFVVKTATDEYAAHALIIATGASARTLGIPGEQEYWGKGVSTCATCDGFFFRDKKVIVVGGGDSAMEEATFLTRFAREVVLVHRKDVFRASKIMQEKVFHNKKIRCVMSTEVIEVLGEQSGATGVRLRNAATGEEAVESADGVFIAIGHVPNTALLGGALELDELGYIKTHEGTRTNIEGVFACGDVMDHVYRQAITAAGTGCMAALDTERWLAHHHDL